MTAERMLLPVLLAAVAAAVADEAPARPLPALPAPAAGSAAANAPTGEDFTERTRAFEARLLGEALEAARFNQKQAAIRLGLTYYQFRHHLRVHGMLTGRRQAQGEAQNEAEA